MQDKIPDALIAAFERHYAFPWDEPTLRNERLAWRAAWTEATKPCLLQIQEPSSAEQAAWHAAVAVPEHVKALHDAEARLTLLIERGKGKLLDVVARDACRAALAATPAAAAPVVLPEPVAWRDALSALVEQVDAGTTADYRALQEHRIMRSARALLAGVSAPAAMAVTPEWDKVRRGLTMLMLGFSGRPDCTESAAEAALDAATEPGMPLASLRILSGAQAEQEVHDDAMDWDQLPEDPSERAMFDRNLELLYGGDPRIPIATSLRIWANTRGIGSFGLMCAILANEVAKLHIAPQAQVDARDAQLLAFAVSEIRRDEMTDSALLDAMEQKRIAVVPEYEGPWDAEIYNDEGKPNHRGSGSTPREAIRAAIAAQAAQQGGAA